MVRVSEQVWKQLESRSGTLFLAAGVLVVLYAGLHGIEAASDMVLEPNPFEFGYVLGFLGLLGLYPAVADDSPWLARAGAGAALLGMIGLSAFTVLHLAELAGVVTPSSSPEQPGLFGVFLLFPLIGFVVGYLSIGVASLRTHAHSRTVGFLLLVPGIIVVVMIVQIVMGWTSQLQAFVISAGEAMAHLAIGATLRMNSRRGQQEPSSGETEVELTSDD
jgi:hypothetical protein